jgi:acetyl esterase/lipase
MPSTDFHPDLRRLGRLLPKQVVTPRTYRLMRYPHRILGRRTPSHIEVVRLRPGVSVRLFVPALTAVPCPALLWIHSGGYVIGAAALDDNLCARFASELGAIVAAVDYRLAPEHPYPAALHDCYAALTWLVGLPSVDSERVAVGGASAGGGLAAALALMARDHGGPSIRAQLLVYPMLDDRTADRPQAEHPKCRLWNRGSNRFGWRSYLGDTNPNLAVPARRTDLAGLAPAWIGVGDFDLFHDENLAYAEQLKAAGVPCEVTVVPGAFHGFDALRPKAQVARSFFNSQCAMLRLAFAPK